MPRVLAAGKLHPSGLELLQAAPDLILDYVEEISSESLVPAIYETDALLLRTQPLPADLIAKCKSLKMVSRHGVGYDAVDVAALNERGIPLAVVGDVNSRTVAEHAMMLMLAAGKRLLKYDSAARGTGWNYRNSFEARELYGKVLLIIGLGRIGRHLARLANAFGMTVIAHDPFVEQAQIESEEIRLEAELKDALMIADYVSVHTPKTDGPVIGADELLVMKTSAIVINAARGGVVDEFALAEALRNKQIAAAGLDVFESEPPAQDNPLFAMDNVVLTPHAAGLTEECAERMAVASAQNILDFFAGKLDPALVVNAAHCAAIG